MKTSTDWKITVTALGALALVTLPASAAITISQQNAPAPTYNTLLTFDEVGTPTGLVPSNTWQSSHGVTITDGVNGPNTQVDNYSGTYPWINSGNSNYGFWGVFMTFDQDVVNMSFQAWDPSGPPDFFGNGLTILVMDSSDNILQFAQFTGAWGGIGDTWIDIVCTGGDSFAKIVITNNSFDPSTWVDNVSWTNVPAPGSLALIGVAGLIGRKRRRH